MLLTWRVVGGRLRVEREKRRALHRQVQLLTKERDDLAALNLTMGKFGRSQSSLGASGTWRDVT